VKTPKPQPLFATHWRVFLQDTDHAGIKASIYDWDKASIPSALHLKQVLDRRAEAQRKGKAAVRA
jgi:hypothetical protein